MHLLQVTHPWTLLGSQGRQKRSRSCEGGEVEQVPSVVVDARSLEAFKASLDGAVIVSFPQLGLKRSTAADSKGLELDDLKRIFQPKRFCGSRKYSDLPCIQGTDSPRVCFWLVCLYCGVLHMCVCFTKLPQCTSLLWCEFPVP